jgi:hypothetical protein
MGRKRKESDTAVLKRWLRRLIRGGCYQKAPGWVVEELRHRGVPIQVDGTRHGTEWEWMTVLEDQIEGEKVDGEQCARMVLKALE